MIGSPNTSVPCPCGVLIIHWTGDVGLSFSVALFMCSFCTGSGCWLLIGSTVASTRQTHSLAAQPAAICCLYGLDSKPTLWRCCCRVELYNCIKAVFKGVLRYSICCLLLVWTLYGCCCLGSVLMLINKPKCYKCIFVFCSFRTDYFRTLWFCGHLPWCAVDQFANLNTVLICCHLHIGLPQFIALHLHYSSANITCCTKNTYCKDCVHMTALGNELDAGNGIMSQQNVI